jgi:hypothetical protein
MRRIMTALIAVAAVVAAATSARPDDYTYIGPALATDSGLSCVGATAASENLIDRAGPWGAVNHLTADCSYLAVFCPLQRRNVAAYGRTTSNPDSVLINKVTVFVRSSSSCGVLRCRVYGYSAR